MEIAEVIRRWQAGPGPQQIAQGTGFSRNTVRKYLAAARAMGIAKDGPPPGEEQLSLLAVIGQSGPRRMETPRQDALERWADYIYRWLTGDRLQMTRIHELLAARGCPVSYPSLRRFLVKRNWRRAGLCHSRHCFLWPMRQQKLEDVIAGWRRPGPSSTG